MPIDSKRPLALWGLVSANVFTERPTPDFYLGLLPFFEPFIQINDGRLLNTTELKTYAEIKLLLPLSDDVADLFIARMERVGWLEVVAADLGAKIYRCHFSGTPVPEETHKEIESRIVALVGGFRRYLSDKPFHLHASHDDVQIEENILRFLSRHLLADDRETESSNGPTIEDTQIEYWIAKYIAWLNLNDTSNFEFIQKLSGILLLAEALVEIRNPSQSTERARTLVVFLDGPLLMQYMGLSGKRAKENASFVIDKLRQSGTTIASFRHSCDEIRDNLTALLGRSPPERTGPSAEAIRQREVTETFLANVRNNVEHFVKNLAKVQIMPLQIHQFRHAERFCDDALNLRLTLKMPAQSELARERDAHSITIIMRRRGGEETADFFASKFVLITSNDALIRRANEVLREYKALGADRALIGPAMHHRIVAGLLFANFGLTEKKEVSRRELLALCARVVTLRPKVLERLRQQVSLLNRPEDSAVVDVLLAQPRASEIIMDRTIGSARSISAANVEEIIAAIKRTAADDVRTEYEELIKKERSDAGKTIETATRELIIKLQTQKEGFEGEREVRQSERAEVTRKIAELERQLVTLVDDQAKREKARKADFQKFLGTALVAATDTLRRVVRREKIALITFIAVLCPVFFIPAILTTNWLAPWLGSIVAFASLVGTAFFVWNRQITIVNKHFERKARGAVDLQLQRLGMESLRSHMKIDYGTCTVTLIGIGDDAIESSEVVDHTPKLKL